MTYVCSVRKTSEWPLCVFIAYYGTCSDAGVIWQPSYSMCDVMCCLLDTVPMFWRNLCTTQHEITFQPTVILNICQQEYLVPIDKMQ